MKKKAKWRMRALVASCVCGAAAFIGGVAFSNESNSAVVKADAEAVAMLAEHYVVGDTVDFSGSSLSYQGVEYPATAYVTDPNGKRVVGGEYVLEQAGAYTIVYKYVSDDLYLEDEKEIFVSKELFEVSSSKSSAVYTDFPSSFSNKGIVVKLANGDTFAYNRILDLSKVSASDKILQFFHNPNTPGAMDALRVEFVLTDIYDPTNYVTIIAKVLGDGMYMTVNAAQQPATGMTACKKDTISSEKKIIWRNQYYIMQVNNRYGTWFGYKFNGIPTSGRGIGSECIEFSMDGTAFLGATGKLLADLGDKEQFTNIWTGFTTGEVYLTIKGAGYEKSTMNFVIPSILNHDLSMAGMKDEQAPSLEIALNGDAPDAIVGKAYKTFDWQATDDYTAEVDCTTRVYYNYYSSTRSRVEVKNGAFTPTYTGVYTIEYTAKDEANNTTVKTVDVVAKDDIKAMEIALSDYKTEFAVGDKVVVAKPEITSSYAENAVKIEAILEGGETVYEIDEKDLTFVPFYDGKYVVRYTATNYVETVVREYEANVAKTTKQYIFDEATMPKYLIKDATYELPTLYFYDFASGEPVKKNSKISVFEDGAATATTLESNIYKVGANSIAKIVYSTLDGNDKAEYDIPVVDVGFGVRLGLQMDKYFYTSDITTEKKEDCLVFTANKAGNAKAEFINRLSSKEVTVSFSLLKDIKDYEAIHFYVTDAADENTSVKLTYRWLGNQVSFSVNDGKASVVDSNAGDECNLEFKYHYETAVVSQLSGVETKIATTANGDTFTGFGDYVYLSFEIEGANAGAGFRFSKINNQMFSSKGLDGIEPRIYAEALRGYKPIGTEVTLKASMAVDVLCPTVTYTVRVTDPSGNTAQDISGIKMDENADLSIDHILRLDKVGKYTIKLEASDKADNRTSYIFTITVTDITPPELTLENAATSAKVGDSVRLAEAKYDEADVKTLYIVVMRPDSSMEFVEKDSLKVTMKGVYYVSYYATDATGNVAIKSYSIKVD